MAEPRATDSAEVLVIVPFIDWGPLLERCVAHCLADADDRVRLCLVGSRPARLPSRWADDPRVTLLEATEEGISHKRNLAIRGFPKAELYACIDSDAWPQPGWLRAARRIFDQHPDIWLVGGPNLNPPGLPPARVPVARALLSPLVSGPKLFTKWQAPSRDARDLPACNLWICRAAIDAIGGFDESVEVGEDSLLCRRVLAHGKRIRFDREVCVFHEPRAFGRPFLQQRIVSGYGIPPLLARCWRTMGMASICAELSPALALLWFVGGWPLGRLSPALALLWQATLGLYLALLAVETLRVGGHPRRWPRVLAALLVGNLAPGLGILYRLGGGRLAIHRVYRNSEGGPITPGGSAPQK